MASHAWGGDSPGLVGFHHWGGGGLGVLGSQIAVGGYLDSSIDQTTEANTEFYGIITGEPSGLVFEEVGEDSGFVASSIPSNGFYAVPFDLYQWGAKIGSNKFTQTFGSPAAGANLSAIKMTGGGLIASGPVGYAPPIGGVTNLAGALLNGASLFQAGAITFTPQQGGVTNLAGATLTSATTFGVGVATVGGGGTANRTITYVLRTKGVIQANLSGLEWALFSAVRPSLFGLPVAQGANETTDDGGVLQVMLNGTSIPAGQYFLVVTSADGTLTVAAIVTVV